MAVSGAPCEPPGPRRRADHPAPVLRRTGGAFPPSRHPLRTMARGPPNRGNSTRRRGSDRWQRFGLRDQSGSPPRCRSRRRNRHQSTESFRPSFLRLERRPSVPALMAGVGGVRKRSPNVRIRVCSLSPQRERHFGTSRPTRAPRRGEPPRDGAVGIRGRRRLPLRRRTRLRCPAADSRQGQRA